MKKAKKIFSYTLSGLAIIYGLILIFPQVLFSNSITHKNFTLYYHSDTTNIPKLKLILDKSVALLSESEVFDAEKKQNIFLCGSFSEFTFFAPRSRKSFAVNYPLVQNIFLSESNIEDNRVKRNASENNIRTLSGVIAHETTHSLLEDKLGIFKYKLLSSWKNEGYCDHIAKESSFDEQLGRSQICENENDDSPSFRYFKYKTYVQFLLEEKVSLDSLLTQDYNLEVIALMARKKYCESPD